MHTKHTFAVAVAMLITVTAHASVLLDYGYEESFNDAGVVRGTGGQASGFGQFQSFIVPDAPWRLDSATLRVRLWNVASTGEVEIAIYAADGLVPDLTGSIAESVSLNISSLSTEPILADLGGLVLSAGTYYVGLVAAGPTTDVLWMPGEVSSARHAVREDGQVFTNYNPSLSLLLDGDVVPATPTVAVLTAAGVGLASRRR